MIYLDYNATSPLCEPAQAAMQPFLDRHFGNPSSVHAAGREARAGVDDARDRLAGLLGAKPHELVFTSSGTESNNLAVLGLARAHAERGRHLICATTEHHAVLQAFEHLGTREGFEVTFLRVNELGRVDPDDLQRAIREDTTVVSIMTANNETGVLQPMEELADLCRTARRPAPQRHGSVLRKIGNTPGRERIGRRQLRRAQISWTKRSGAPLSSRRVADRSHSVRRGPREPAPAGDRKCARDRGHGCRSGMDSARSRAGAGPPGRVARSSLETDPRISPIGHAKCRYALTGSATRLTSVSPG